MRRCAIRWTFGGVVLGLAFLLTGCGDSKKDGPKVADPNAPKLDRKAAGSGKPGAPKGSSE